MEVEKKNYYEVLEISTSSTPQQIENAYIRARNAYSSDSVALYSLMTKDECNAILGQIEEAYSVLGFPEKRREYDRVRGFNVQTTGTTTAQGEELQYENFGSIAMESKVSKITAQKKFGLEFTENTDMERRILECVEFTGPFLKEIREYKNVSVERMADMTRISKSQINSIESEIMDKLPADVYIRGYVYQMAKVLKLNPDQVANSYMFRFKKIKNPK